MEKKAEAKWLSQAPMVQFMACVGARRVPQAGQLGLLRCRPDGLPKRINPDSRGRSSEVGEQCREACRPRKARSTLGWRYGGIGRAGERSSQAKTHFAMAGSHNVADKEPCALASFPSPGRAERRLEGQPHHLAGPCRG